MTETANVPEYSTALSNLKIGLGEEPEYGPDGADIDLVHHALWQFTVLAEHLQKAAEALKHNHMCTGLDLTDWVGPRELVQSFYPGFYPVGEGVWVEDGHVYGYKDYVWYGEHADKPKATPFRTVPSGKTDAEYAADASAVWRAGDYAAWIDFLGWVE